MCISKSLRKWRKKRRDRIYEGPCIDGGTRIRNDTNAPKEIESRELTTLFCHFSTLTLVDEGDLPRGIYKLTAKGNNESVHCTVECSGTSQAEGTREWAESRELFVKADELLRKYDVARQNGISYKVSGLPEFFGICIDAAYQSGERLYCYNNQDLIFPIDFIRELCALFGIKKKSAD